MNFKVFRASQGMVWLKAGWRVFKTQPFTFVMMHLFIIIVSVVPLLAPILNIAAALIAPFLTLGLYQAVVSKQQGQTIQLSSILQPLLSKGRRLGVFRLALCQVLVALLVAQLAGFLFADVVAVMQQTSETTTPEQLLEQLAGAFDVGNILLFVMALTLNYMAFAFALPLVYFKNVPLWSAIQLSFQVFTRNVAPLTVFGLLVAFAVVISLPLQLIPLLAVLPISYIGFFVAYQTIFSDMATAKDSAEQTTSVVAADRFDA
ncbi:BPSS1780 family membrane protein [Pseudoalteromonas fenneropenaei]|uniref:BPSS1780 family membrane protein n=1 Tax=Pseudoalteromonas fenneropenaei TaxID=1737459 RepID=A0ABV7CCQ6_9GAMM